MKKYRINKASEGFNLYRMRDMGNGWDKQYLSHHDTKEQAEKELKRLQEQENKNLHT